MKTSDSFALMEQLLPDLEELLGDEDIRAFKEEVKGAGQIVASSAMSRLMPLFTGKHRDALLRVIAACNDKTVEQVKSQELADTIADMRSGFTDEVYSFFRAVSAAGPESVARALYRARPSSVRGLLMVLRVDRMDEAREAYTAEALRRLVVLGSHGKVQMPSYWDYIAQLRDRRPADKRSAQQIKADLLARLEAM